LDFAYNTHSQNFDDTITVLAGLQGWQQKFTIHKDLICASSKFFKAACSKLWSEGQEKVVRLPEVKVETFQAYVVWVYTGKIAVNKPTQDCVRKFALEEYREAVELYLVGDVLDDLLLRNTAMRTLVTKRKVWQVQPDLATIHQIRDSTPPESRLRQMIVDVTIKRMHRANIDEVASYPADLLKCIALKLLQQVPTVFNEAFVSRLDDYLEPEGGENSGRSK
jgi:hypothetical protein